MTTLIAVIRQSAAFLSVHSGGCLRQGREPQPRGTGLWRCRYYWPCQEGGGYNLVVEVFKANGNQLSQRNVELGGGPKMKVPKWALDFGKAPIAPALDDEDVPQGFEFFDSGSAGIGVSPDVLLEKQ
jgi:hypothetical protein